MMEKIRITGNHIVIKIIFSIIIIAFIFIGVNRFLSVEDSSIDDEQLYIAKVDGEGISRSDFENQVSDRLSQTLILGNNELMIKDVRQKVLSSNIDNYLRYKLSSELNLVISDQKLNNIIQQQKVFYADGVFNYEHYLALLNQNGYTRELYEELLKAEEQKKQLTTALLLSDFSLPIESELSELINQKREGYYTSVYVNDITDKSEIEVTQEQAQDYYNNNQQQFIRGDRIKIKFLTNSYADAMKKAKMPTEDECKNEYKKNKTLYTEPTRYEFVLIEADSQAAANKLSSAIKSKKNGSLVDPKKMINLGWFTKTTIPDFLENSLTKKNQTQVKVIDGKYYVILLKDVKDQQTLPFEYVYMKIKHALFTERAKNIYNDKNEQLLQAIENDTSLEDIAKTTELELYEPEDWQEKAKMDTFFLLSYPELQNIIFDQKFINDNNGTGKVAQLIEIHDPKSTYLVQISDFKSKGLAPYDEVYNKVVSSIIINESKGLFVEKVNEIVSTLNESGQDPRIAFSTKYNLTRDSQEFKDSTKDMIYSLIPPVKNKRVFGADFITSDSAIVSVLTKVENGDYFDMSTDLKQLNQKMLYTSLNLYLISKAKIEIMPNSNL